MLVLSVPDAERTERAREIIDAVNADVDVPGYSELVQAHEGTYEELLRKISADLFIKSVEIVCKMT